MQRLRIIITFIPQTSRASGLLWC